MKKLTAGFCAIALAAVPTAQVMAAPSIGTSGPKDPVVSGGSLEFKDTQKLVIKEVTPDLYGDTEVADVVSNFNDDEKVTTALEVHNSVQLQATDVKVDAPDLAEGETIVVKDHGHVAYENKDVETAVKAFNEKFGTFEIHTNKDGEVTNYVSTAKPLADFVKELKEALKAAEEAEETEEETSEASSETEEATEAETEKETSEASSETEAEEEEESSEVFTNKENRINVEDYKSMFAFADMLVYDSKELKIKETGEFTLTMTLDSLKDMNAEDLLFVAVNPYDGTISYIEPDEFDAETGTITGTFNHVGPFTIVTKGEFEVTPPLTNKDNVILPQQYEALTGFVDLAIEDLDNISYEMDGNVQVTFTCELTVDMDEEDIVLLTVDQETREKKYLELDDFDPKTGEITVTFENLGPFTILTKVIPDEDITVVDEEEETSEEATEEASEEASEEATEEETSAAAKESK